MVFRDFIEFDSSIDGFKILGYNKASKTTPSCVDGYILNRGRWLRSQKGGSWVESSPPDFYVPYIEIMLDKKPRGPSLAKIESLTEAQALWYYKKDRGLIPDITEAIKKGLIEKYHKKHIAKKQVVL